MSPPIEEMEAPTPTTPFCVPSSVPQGRSLGSRRLPDLARHETVVQFASAARQPRPKFHRAHSESASQGRASPDAFPDRREALMEWPPPKRPDQSATSDTAHEPGL